MQVKLLMCRLVEGRWKVTGYSYISTRGLHIQLWKDIGVLRINRNSILLIETYWRYSHDVWMGKQIEIEQSPTPLAVYRHRAWFFPSLPPHSLCTPTFTFTFTLISTFILTFTCTIILLVFFVEVCVRHQWNWIWRLTIWRLLLHLAAWTRSDANFPNLPFLQCTPHISPGGIWILWML